MRHSSNTITLSEELIVEDEIEELRVEREVEKYSQNIHGQNIHGQNIHGQNIQRTKKSSSPEVTANESRGKTKLEESLTKLVRLIANVTESYTSAIFVADTKNRVLHSLAHHSLSREYVEGIQIPYGRGLVGWTAENKVRITVCPFEHDASTLLYYPSDQGLKSFIAVPILTSENEVIGVITCDSKKSYAFAKITEKILTECAAQAELLIQLHQANESLSSKRPLVKSTNALDDFIEKLRAASSEAALFEITCSLSQSILKRDALIALVTSNEGYGEATFYSKAPDARVEHHLMDLVCKNKKIISTEKSVHVLPSDDIRARSFLSVPFHIYGKEAGALNILSAAFEPFSTADIQTLEKLAKVIGRELEHHRSKAIAHSRQVGPSLLPWKHFTAKSEAMLFSAPGAYTLLRIQFEGLLSLEETLGVDTLTEVHEQMIRFVQQLAPNPMLASAPYGTSIFVFGLTNAIHTVKNRLGSLVSRIHTVQGTNPSNRLDASAGELLHRALSIKVSTSGKKTSSLKEMISMMTKDGIAPQSSIFSSFLSKTEREIPKDTPRNVSVEEEILISLEEELDVTKTPAPESVEAQALVAQSSNAKPHTPPGSNNFSMGRNTRREQKSIEEFILGESAANLKDEKNARFW